MDHDLGAHTPARSPRSQPLSPHPLRITSGPKTNFLPCACAQVADIGHCALPMEIHKEWVTRLEEEFFLQVGNRRHPLARSGRHRLSSARAVARCLAWWREVMSASICLCQGDREKAAGRDQISALMDREKPG